MRELMKRLILIALSLIFAISLCSCTRIEFEYDIDLTEEKNLYDVLADYISHPEKCKDKNVKLRAECTVVYNFSENKIARHSIIVRDNDSDMRALYEIRAKDGKYPKTGTVALLGGKFTDGYIEIREFIKADFSKSSFDVDALSMSASELKDFLSEFNEKCNESENFGKSIKIYGNINIFDKKYAYLNGFDENGSRTWTVELTPKDASVKLPTSNTKQLNAYEIIGTLEMYMEDHIAYPCIKVSEIKAIEGVLKVEETQIGQPVINPMQ